MKSKLCFMAIVYTVGVASCSFDTRSYEERISELPAYDLDDTYTKEEAIEDVEYIYTRINQTHMPLSDEMQIAFDEKYEE
ncbi:MAG: hypothetical protein ACK5LV_09555 [Lachnospirales bacterium]